MEIMSEGCEKIIDAYLKGLTDVWLFIWLSIELLSKFRWD